MKEKIKKIEELYKKAVTEAFGRIEEQLAEFEKTGKQKTQEEIKENFIKCRRRAIKYIDEILEIDSKNIKALELKGFVLGDMGEFGQAEFYYDQALKINPNDYSALSGKAYLLTKQGRYELAIDFYEKAHEIDPSNITTLFSIRECLLELMDSYGKLLQKYNNQSSDWWKELSLKYNNLQKKFTKIDKKYNKAIEKDKGVQEARKQLEELQKEELKKQGYIIIEKKSRVFGKIKNIFKKEHETK